ncbi:MAG: FeoA domain-containing protein [Desulfovibrionaceae bacterium]
MDRKSKGQKSLCRFPEGTLVRVEDLAGCRNARSRLYAMGLTPGTELEVISSGPGPCRLRVRGSDLVLGHGLADKIIACPVGACLDPDNCAIEDAES